MTGSASELPTIPVSLRVHLAHATVQAIADEVGVDLLHIKGPATDPSLRPEGRASVDADVLVRPSHLERLTDGLCLRGWQRVTRLAGGAILHSTNWYHGELGQADIHMRFPGIQASPECAFEEMWKHRSAREIAHRKCAVPSLNSQRLIQLLHAARDGRAREGEVAVAWTDATQAERDGVHELACALEAEVALAAATGRLERYRGRPEYEMWRLYADRDDANALRSIVVAARATPAGLGRPSVAAIRRIADLALHKRERLAGQLMRDPSATETGRGYLRLLRRLAKEIGEMLHR